MALRLPIDERRYERTVGGMAQHTKLAILGAYVQRLCTLTGRESEEIIRLFEADTGLKVNGSHDAFREWAGKAVYAAETFDADLFAREDG